MDIAQLLVLDLGWIFFVAWATVLAAISVVAFGRDFLAWTSDTKEHPKL